MISDRITEDTARCAVRVQILNAEEIRDIRSKMPDLASQGKLYPNAYARALIVRGLSLLESKNEISWIIPDYKTSNSLKIPAWVDAWIYELAHREGRSMGEIAQTALELGRAQVLSSR